MNELIGERLYGSDNYKQVGDINTLVGKFNYSTASKLLINVDEATFGGYNDQANRLKGIITEPMTEMEQKGVDSRQVESHINLIFTSNEEYPVHIDKDDRRYYVIEATKDPSHDQAYFRALSARMTDGRVAQAFYRWLISRDLTGFNPRDFEMTDAKRAMQNQAREGFDMRMQDVCRYPHNLLDCQVAQTRPQNIYPDDAYRAYSAWYEREQQGAANAKKLGKGALCTKIHQLLGTSGKNPKDREGKRCMPFPTMECLTGMLKAQNRWDDAIG